MTAVEKTMESKPFQEKPEKTSGGPGIHSGDPGGGAEAPSRSTVELEAERDHYVDLFENAPVGYLLLDEAGCLKQLNLCAARMLDRNVEDLPGRSFRALLRRHDRPCFTGFLDDLARGGAGFMDAALTREPPVLVRLYGRPQEPTPEVPGCFRIIMVDVTRESRGTEALRAGGSRWEDSARAWRVMAGESDELTSLVGLDGTILCATRALHELLGYPDGELEGRHVRALAPHSPAWTSLIPLQTFLAAPAIPAHATMELVHKTGESHRYYVSAKIVRMGDRKGYLIRLSLPFP